MSLKGLLENEFSNWLQEKNVVTYHLKPSKKLEFVDKFRQKAFKLSSGENLDM